MPRTAASSTSGASASSCADVGRPQRRPPFLGAPAIAGAGLAPGDVDGVASFRFLEDSVPTQAVATALGLPGANWLLDLNLGGQAPCYLVTQAAMAVHLGLAR